MSAEYLQALGRVVNVLFLGLQNADMNPVATAGRIKCRSGTLNFEIIIREDLDART